MGRPAAPKKRQPAPRPQIPSGASQLVAPCRTLSLLWGHIRPPPLLLWAAAALVLVLFAATRWPSLTDGGGLRPPAPAPAPAKVAPALSSAASLAPPAATLAPAATAPAAPNCAPRFLGYAPSKLELDWEAHVSLPGGSPLNQRLLCKDIVSDAFFEPFQAWVGAGATQNAQRPPTRAGLAAQAAALAARDDVFSVLRFDDPCHPEAAWSVRTSPLAGLLRDPRGPCLFASGEFVQRPLLPMLQGGGEMLQVKDTVVVDAAHMQRWAAHLASGGRRRAILMDAGASTYAQGVVAGEWPGTRWLVERYRDQGINFTDIFCWEVTAHPGSEFFDGMPVEVMAATRFFNFPVTAEAGPANPISVLKATARPGDFVVFKLDIDHPYTEGPLVDALLADPEALALIDTFFYELHYGLKEMEGFWGGGLPGDFASAKRVFARLREAGVNAQFWP